MIINCKQCNEEFKATESQIKNNKQFCSKNCYHSWRSEFLIKTGKNIKCECKICRKQYLTYYQKPKYLKEFYSIKYCSEKCKNYNLKLRIARKKLIFYETYIKRNKKNKDIRRSPSNKFLLEAKCNYCGKWYSPKFTSKEFYCKKDCKKESLEKQEANQEIRKMVFKRDGYRCQMCKKTRNLQCHEFIKNEFITLCKQHHNWSHTKVGTQFYKP